VAFNLDSCPKKAGWEDYQPAYGRFVRGIDKTGTVNPEGILARGTLSDDQIKSHTHKALAVIQQS